MWSTSKAAQRIDGKTNLPHANSAKTARNLPHANSAKTIHSALRITNQGGTFLTRAITDPALKSTLAQVKTIIIDEVSMVSAQLLSFISDTFAKIQENSFAFGGSWRSQEYL